MAQAPGVEAVDRLLGRWLVQRGLLGVQQLEAALGLSGPGRRLEVVLAQQGWVDPAALGALRSEPLPATCARCGARAPLLLGQLEAGGAACACGGELHLDGRSGSGRLAPRPWGLGPTTPATGSGTAHWASGSARAAGGGQPLESAQAGSGTARLVAPAGSGSTRWAAGAGGVPGLPLGAGTSCGPYRLLDELGSGGYGVVFRAWDPRHEREVAIKLLTSTSPRARQRFEREVKATARLSHPNIVPLLDSGEHEGTLYLVMELVRGRTLADRSEGSDRLPLEASVRAVRDVARAIDYAHREGILHRDLKPHNVLIDPEGRPHVVDFGLAQLEERQAQLTRTGAAIGTPAYMPPEQARSDGSADARSDVYALGATLYHALTGRPPFAGESGPEMLLAIFRQEPDAPSRHDRRVPVDLDTVCLKCLEKAPARRYAGAGELADDLERWLRGEPVRARPLSPARRAARRVRAWAARRRRGTALLAGGGALALLCLGLLGAEWVAAGRGATGAGTAEADRLAAEAAAARQRAQEEQARSQERVAQARRLLQAAEERPLELQVDQVLHQLGREPDPAVAALLTERLQAVARDLWAVEREMLLAARDPDADEALAGVRPLSGLGEALDARAALRPGQALAPAATAVLAEAEERVKRRAYRNLNPEARRTPPRLLDLLGSAQEARLGQGRLLVARVACEALGRLAAREAIPALADYLRREGDPLRALYAARALAQLDDPAVEAPLRDALARFGEGGLLGEQLRRGLDRQARR